MKKRAKDDCYDGIRYFEKGKVYSVDQQTLKLLPGAFEDLDAVPDSASSGEGGEGGAGEGEGEGEGGAGEGEGGTGEGQPPGGPIKLTLGGGSQEGGGTPLFDEDA